ncbi:hypothetical protein BCR39DRAFT_544502 [Naematelia encephala]|uniref:Exoribonuclease phosphorolytic domain-containing protein n=1 Tax=Naematelia encephala TaxID=71784 RepID=A0A1Y2AT38_9TREE|nr:hypothetical protein BCR39DRAFT_544502 [Naematelia encephala]
MSSSRRSDGRSDTSIRELQIQLGRLDRADGSARFGFGATAALASFSGPIEVRPREEQPTRATFEITHRPLEGVAATPSRALITTLEAVLAPLVRTDQYPRSLLQLVVQSLSPSPQAPLSTSYSATSTSSSSTSHTWPPPDTSSEDEDDDGYIVQETDSAPMGGTTFASRAAAINASTLALLDAGSISMRGVPVAVSLALVPLPPKQVISAVNGDGSGGGGDGDGRIVVDPSLEEESRSRARFGFGWAFGEGLAGARQDASDEMDVDEQSSEELVWSEAEGKFNKSEYEQALALSKAASRHILGEIRQTLTEHFASTTI